MDDVLSNISTSGNLSDHVICLAAKYLILVGVAIVSRVLFLRII
jgi:hypothetical protein